MPVIQIEILKLLYNLKSNYANPVNSRELGKLLNVTPSYIREQAKKLQKEGYVSVRKGPGGGYFLSIKGDRNADIFGWDRC